MGSINLEDKAIRHVSNKNQRKGKTIKKKNKGKKSQEKERSLFQQSEKKKNNGL